MAKKKETKKLWLVNSALTIAGGLGYLKLKKASKNPRKTSAATLRGILEYAKDSEYGKKNHFAEILAAKSDDELFQLWQKNVKPNDYEDLRPYINRHKKGEENLLFPGKPLMYATTSGTTKEPKWVPITQVYLNNVYSKMTKVWLFNFIKNRPHVYEGPIVSIVGKAVEGHAEDGTVFGSVSGVTQRDCPGFIKAMYTNPSSVYAIPDYTARYYAIMRLSIEHDIHLVVTANPSSVLEMQKCVDTWYDEMVKDIENGTLSDKVTISDEIRADIAPFLKKNPERAAELRKLKEEVGRPLFKHYWPDLQVLNTWKCGNTRVYIEKMKGFFPDGMLHQEFGYFSSECRFGLVLDETNNTVLFPHFHYYEFVPEEDVLAPDFLNDPSKLHFLQLDELEKGKRYCPFVTTYAGMYRYCMNDLVEASDLFVNTPTVFMVQKINGIVTMTGEKLHESQFIGAVKQAEQETGLKTHFFVGFAYLEESKYHFYYEFDQDVTQEQCDAFTAKVDAILRKENIEYDAKRASFRVGDPVGHLLVENSFDKFKATRIAEGANDGQFKMLLLQQNEKLHDRFRKLVKE